MARIIAALAEIADGYDALFCDLWGCLHDGVRAHPEAVEALRGFRAGGGKVVLVTNAPRPRASVERQIEGLAVPRDCWDVIATSGDSARTAMFEGAVGRRIHHIGTEADLSFFAPIRIVRDAVPIERVALSEAEGIVCTGPEDPHADPGVYRDRFQLAISRGLKLLCANPDVVVDRGETREWCAGALAALYTGMGGTSLYFGKPHAPIYALARRRLAEVGGDPEGRILAVGDGIATDIEGALVAGIDALFVTGGLAAHETETDGDPDPAALARYVAHHRMDPAFAIGMLR